MNNPSISYIPNHVDRFYLNRPVIITGGFGMLGTHVTRILKKMKAQVFTFRSIDYNLFYEKSTMSAFEMFINSTYKYKKEPILIHLAALVSGIEATRTSPVAHLDYNVRMASNVFSAAYINRIRLVVAAGSVCAYPERTPIPMNEKNLFEGKPEPTNFSYGMSKRFVLSLLEAYRQEGRFENYAFPLSANLYGPYDDFNQNTSHVIPALIMKSDIAAAENKPLTVWGTGCVTRDFLYVQDAAKAYILAGYYITQTDRQPIVCNIGSGEEILIISLAKIICDKMGVKRDIELDTSKPDGQKRRCLDVSLAKDMLGWKSETDIVSGLEKTIDYYRTDIRPYLR